MAITKTRSTVPGPVQTPDSPENAVVKAALGFKDISVDIPADATLDKIQETLAIAIEGYKRLENGLERIKPIIGRILLHIQETKKFRPLYKNFTEFLDTIVVQQMGFGRSTAFDALRIARAFPHLTTDEYQNYGATRLLYAARVTDETDANYRELLNHSTQVSTEAFLDEVTTKIQEGRPPSTTLVLSLRVLPATKTLWEQLLESTAQTPDDLLTMLMHQFKNQRPK